MAAEASDDSPSYACSGVAAAGTNLWSPASDELRPNLAVPESVDDAIVGRDNCVGGPEGEGRNRKAKCLTADNL